MIRIFDTAEYVTNAAAAMQAQGLQAVIRYINHSNSQQLPHKRITAVERAAIKTAGLELALVFQQRQTLPQDFTPDAGARAATRAFTYARDVVGRPDGRPIYFSVDNSVETEPFFRAVDGFFTAVNTTLAALAGGGPAVPVGVYGCGAVCARLKAANLASYFWLAGATGWNGYRPFLASGAWHLNQAATAATLAGVPGEGDAANPLHPDFGAFTPTL